MDQKWKQSLYVYVDQCNKSRVVPDEEVFTGALSEAGIRLGQQQRGWRIAKWYSDRAITPRRCETGVKVLRTAQRDSGDVIAEVALHSAFYYEKGGITHREDKVERERLTFANAHGNAGWTVAGVERDIPEKVPRKGAIASPAELSGLEAPPFPGPLLSRRVLGPSVRDVPYRREDAAAYADRWWNENNPEFETFAVDCTNYVSQCLFAGGAPINYTGKRETGWWYKGYVGNQEGWSFSWAVSDSLRRYLDGERRNGLRAEIVERPEQLMLGDVIQYDWDGDGHFQHSTIVTAFDAGGMPLVNAHTVPSRHRFWDYRDSYAWTERTAYRFFHIYDHL
ncbi:amidase domain-containing protein [Paenibacillus zanthoxyli]|uniref:amidase domain-containing protein n=1 Tax=Paenibacillus zanthoxyli TaxID=369399 RepID=UPI0004708E55|nr:amidase domain-containing protein [Paenibacillus zanthoxyli]